jgi:hypothetical protein
MTLPSPHLPRSFTFSLGLVHITHHLRNAWSDFLQATLCGSEPVDLFDSFHVQLRAITNQLMADFQLPPDVQARLAIQPPEEFEIASNVKRTVDSACGSDAEFQRITAEMGLDAEADKQAFRGEMLSVKVRASTF